MLYKITEAKLISIHLLLKFSGNIGKVVELQKLSNTCHHANGIHNTDLLKKHHSISDKRFCTQLSYICHMGFYHIFLSVPDFSVLIAAKSNWCKEDFRGGCFNWDLIDFEAVSKNVGLQETAQEDMSGSGMKIRLSEDGEIRQTIKVARGIIWSQEYLIFPSIY